MILSGATKQDFLRDLRGDNFNFFFDLEDGTSQVFSMNTHDYSMQVDFEHEINSEVVEQSWGEVGTEVEVTSTVLDIRFYDEEGEEVGVNLDSAFLDNFKNLFADKFEQHVIDYNLY